MLTWIPYRAYAERCPTLSNLLVIIVGGIPIAMPTVLSVTLALGAYQLAKHGAIVARMSAVEEMAGALALQPVQCVGGPHGEPQPTTLAHVRYRACRIHFLYPLAVMRAGLPVLSRWSSVCKVPQALLLADGVYGRMMSDDGHYLQTGIRTSCVDLLPVASRQGFVVSHHRRSTRSQCADMTSPK